MIIRRMFKPIATVMMLATFLLPMHDASATTVYTGGTVYIGVTRDFETPRTIYNSGSNIYFERNAGPEIDFTWYKCSDYQVRGWPRYLGDYQRHLIDSDFLPGTVFCLAVSSNQYPSPATFEGWLDWDVYS